MNFTNYNNIHPFLFISTFNRPKYLEKSLQSLLDSIDTIIPQIIITDDGSSDKKVDELIDIFEFNYENKFKLPVITNKNPQNSGLPQGKLLPIFANIFNVYNFPYFLITDSDMIYKKGWIEKLVELYDSTGAPLITGFNTLTNNHDTLKEFDNFRTKKSIGGCNLLVDTKFYKKYPFIPEKSWDYVMSENAWFYVTQHDDANIFGIVCAKPSYVDHIGKEGTWARKNYYDKAEDF